MTTRRVGPDGKIVNALVSSVPVAAEGAPPASRRPAVHEDIPRSGNLLTEDSVKTAVKAYLEGAGWSVTVAWGRNHGVDIGAHRDGEHLYLEAKGEATNSAQQANYFIGALGELVQRLRDPTARYGLALPDNQQFRRLAERLPPLAHERLNLVIMFVDRQDKSTITLLQKD